MGKDKKTEVKKPIARKNVDKVGEKGKNGGGARRKKSEIGVPGLVVLLVLVLVGSVVFVGAASGWFDDKKITLDSEYNCQGECDEVFTELGPEEYDKLTSEKKTFVVFVDQEGCRTAEHLKTYVDKWARENKVKVYRMMFSDMKETSLHDAVKFYPSVAVISKGRPIKWLRADEDADAEAYNDSDAFKNWIDGVLK